LRALRSVMLRLKREPTNDIEDDTQDESPPETSDLITSEDVFPRDQVEDGEEDDRDEASDLWPTLPGPLIAAGAFIPTFLAVFFGLSYLLGGLTQTARTESAPVPSAAALLSDRTTPVTPPLSEALRDPFVAPQPSGPPALNPADPREERRQAFGEEAATPPAVEPNALAPRPTLPPAQPRAAISSTAERRATGAAEPLRQRQAAVLTTTPERAPAAEPRASGRDWTPAAAFADRAAAGRLASSIQQQGYPVEIRQEPSSARPWVVWIGSQPRGGERRR